MMVKRSGFLFFLIPFGFSLLMGWPGVMRPDSVFQLSQALSGAYADHHPPLMALYWGGLNKIWPGPGLMLVTHLSMVWGASYLFYLSCGSQKIRGYFFIFPLIPPVFVYLFFILKDVGFAFSFLLAMSVAAYQNYLAKDQKKCPPFLKVVGFLAVVYGVGVKYQALFLAPFVIYALVSPGSFSLLKTIIISGAFIVFLPLFNGYFSLPSHTWQWVKLYDLTGISLRVDRDLIPDFNRNAPHFSRDHLRAKYGPHRVDDLVDNIHTSPLKVGRNESERAILWNTWFRAVLDYPAAYLDHRWGLFKNLLMTSPLKTKDQVLSCPDLIPNSLFKLMDFLGWMGLDRLMQLALMPIIWVPVMILYFALGLYYRREGEGRTVLLLTVTGLMLPLVLFIFSMASDARYIYLSLCSLHGCHPFIWILIKGGRRRGPRHS